MKYDDLFEKKHNLFLIIFVITVFSLLINGYFYGAADSAMRSALIKSKVDSTIYKNDLMVSQRSTFYTYIHDIFLPLYSAFGIESVSFFIYFIARLFSFLAIFHLSKFLFKDNRVSFLSILFLLVIRPAMGGETFRTFYLEGELALPLILYSFMFMLKKRYLLASFLAGIAVNIHITSALPLYGMLFVCLVFNYRKQLFKKIFFSVAVFLASASPMLFWILFQKSSVQFIVSDFMLKVMKLIVVHHFFVLSWFTNKIYLERWIRFLVFFAAYIIALKYKPSKEVHKGVMAFFYGLIILLILTLVFTYIVPQPLVMNLQFFRSTMWISFFGAIYLSNYIVKEYSRSDTISRLILVGLGASFFISNFKASLIFLAFLFADKFRKMYLVSVPTFAIGLLALFLSALSTFFPNIRFIFFLKLGILPIYLISFCLIAALVLEFSRGKTKPSARSLIAAFALIAVLIFTAFSMISMRKELVDYPYYGAAVYELSLTPLIYPNPISLSALNKFLADPRDYITHSVQYLYPFPRNEWEDVQAWAHDNTKKDEIFITPPDFSAFRLYSERTTAGEWLDVILSTVNEDYAKKIWERMTDLCNSEIFGHCKGEYGHTCSKFCGDQYRKLYEKDFLKLARKYNAWYIVVEKPKTLNFNLVYENNRFKIYKVTK